MAYIKIKSCSECGERRVEPDYMSADSFDCQVKWICTAKSKNGRVIARYVDTFDDDPKIPKWCPKRKK
jgi:hypothetical protein